MLRTPALTLFVPRAILLWVVVRVTLAAFTLAVPGRAQPGGSVVAGAFMVEPVTALLVAAVVAALMLADVRALRERVFLANLGMGRSTAASIAFIASLGLESAIAVVLGLTA